VVKSLCPCTPRVVLEQRDEPRRKMSDLRPEGEFKPQIHMIAVLSTHGARKFVRIV